MIELDDGRVLTESNAILCWLAEGTPYLPGDAWQRAQALSWMFFEQYSHEPYIAVARFICGWTPLDSPRRAELPRLRERGHQALAVMERHLSSHAWFTGEAYGIADIALFAYTVRRRSRRLRVSTRIPRSATGWRACERRRASCRCPAPDAAARR